MDKPAFGELDRAAFNAVAKATDAVVLIAGRDDGAMYLIVSDEYESKALEIVENALMSVREQIIRHRNGGGTTVRPV